VCLQGFEAPVGRESVPRFWCFLRTGATEVSRVNPGRPTTSCSGAICLECAVGRTGYDPRVRVAATCALIATVILSACGRGTGPTTDAARLTEVEAAKLAVADAVDGTKDHVVAKCAVCKLAMDGNTERVSRYAGYQLHFCSQECKKTFDHDPRAVLRRLPMPKR
jgi:YHS domain-containing protein